MESVSPLAFSNSGPNSLNRPASEPPAISLSSEALVPVIAAIITLNTRAMSFVIAAPLIGNRDLGDEGGFAYLGGGEGRAFLEPGARCGRAPQCLAARIVQRPAQRLVVVVHGEVVAGVELEAMAVGIAYIEEERVGDAVAAGAALEVFQVAAGGHDVAEMQHVHRRRHPIAEMVQARSLAVGDGEIVHIALAMQPGGSDAAVGAVLLGI